MIRSMYTAATGMKTQQLYMDVISNNLSNVNSNAFKRQKIEFQDLMYETLREPGARNVEGSMAPSGIEVGLGVKTASTQRIFQQGSVKQTGNDLDVAIHGDGFFQVMLPNGEITYTRDGQFQLNSEGTIVTSNGQPLYPEVTIPNGASDITISEDGLIAARLDGDETSTELGQIELARFINPAGLKSIGSSSFLPSDASGEPVLGDPSYEGMGSLMHQYVEASNVAIVDEMVNMIGAQRAYEIVSKSITVSEEMMQTVNNLKR